ncbi:MAG: helix-turn-helix domain-containing protein [Mycobacteriales bacterium]
MSAADQLALRTGIGRRIESARLAKRWSRNELARRLNLTAFTVWSWETGRSTPTADRLVLMAHAIGVRPGDLLPELPSPPEQP